MHTHYLTWLMLCPLVVACTGAPKNMDQETPTGSEAHVHDPGEIILSAEAAHAAGVATAMVQPAPFAAVIPAAGRIESASGDETVVTASISGTVRLNRSLTPGQKTTAGTALLQLSTANLPTANPAQKAQIDYEAAKSEYERARKLVENKIVSAKDFSAIRARYENAKIAYQALQKNRRPDGVNVTAPFEGYIKQMYVNDGDYVEVGRPLLVMTRRQKLFLKVDVPECYYTHMPYIRSARFTTSYDDRTIHLDSLHGRILSYAKAVEEGAYTLPVTFEFDNRGNLIPGSIVDVYLLLSQQDNALSVPLEALIEEQGSHFVYQKTDHDGYRKREVRLGASDGERVRILSGIAPGDEIVVKGAFQVKLAGASSTIPPHTHEH